MNDLALRLAQRIRELRIQAKLTQAELAARAGVTVETVARLERVLRGRSSANANPSLETLSRIAGALGVDTAELLTSARPTQREDRLSSLLKNASSAARRRVLRVAEVLISDDRSEQRKSRRSR